MQPVRRAQASRSAATREALLDAAIACLIEEGYANTTTGRVGARAGVSRGAHLHHFQTRITLVAAAVERLARRRFDQLPAAAEVLIQHAPATARGLALLGTLHPGDHRNHRQWTFCRVRLVELSEPAGSQAASQAEATARAGAAAPTR